MTGGQIREIDTAWLDADGFEPVLGYRRWVMLPERPLGAKTHVVRYGVAHPRAERHEHDMVQRGHAWEHDGPTRALCNSGYREGHEAAPAPFVGCDCGLYGWHDLQEARGYRAMETGGTGSVLGAAVFWGRVLFDEAWFRAEWAMPVALVDPAQTETSYSVERASEQAAWVAGVAERYGVPVLGLGEIEGYAERFGVRTEV